jgi:hypothetical protein
VPAAEAADPALDPAFLVRSVLAGAAEERVEAVVAAQRDEPLRLFPVPSPEHAHDGGFEVVVADPRRHGPEVREREHMALQERLLCLGGERDVERPPGVRQPHHEHPQLQPDSGDGCGELAEVDLRLGSRLMGLRHCHLDPVQAEFHLAASDVTRHGHLGQRRTVLDDQALPDPPRGMPLLPRHVPIGEQPAVDDLDVRVDRRTRPPRIRLTRRRYSARQRLPHRAAVHVMPVSELADREPLDPPVSPDLLEQLHSRPRHSRPPRRQHRREDRNHGGATIRDDTLHPPTA